MGGTRLTWKGRSRKRDRKGRKSGIYRLPLCSSACRDHHHHDAPATHPTAGGTESPDKDAGDDGAVGTGQVEQGRNGRKGKRDREREMRKGGEMKAIWQFAKRITRKEGWERDPFFSARSTLVASSTLLFRNSPHIHTPLLSPHSTQVGGGRLFVSETSALSPVERNEGYSKSESESKRERESRAAVVVYPFFFFLFLSCSCYVHVRLS